MDQAWIKSSAGLCDKIRAARENSGLSARVVAGMLQARGHAISHSTVCNIEKGKAVASPSLLGALGAIYGLEKDWCLGPSPVMTGVRYRCLKSVRVGDKRKYEAEALRWFCAYLAAEDCLGKPLRWRFEGFRVGAQDTGAEVALEIRKLFKFGIYPVPSMVRVLEEFGVHIVQLETPARIDEFAGYIDGNPVVVINPNLSNDRIRFNAGHALAHHLFRDCCRGGKGLSEEEVERRAHECASHLLIPEDQLANAFELKSMVRLVQYKERFGISLAAMIYRAKAAGLIPQDLYERLWREFSRLGWRVQEPGYVPPDRPVRMEALFDAAVCQKKMTYTRIAQLAGVDELTVKSRVLRAMGGSVSLVDRVEKGSVICLDEYRQELADKEGEP